MAISQNLVIDQGTTFTAEVSIFTDDKYRYDLLSYTAAAQMRKSPTSTTATSFTCTVGTPPYQGVVTISLTATQTLALTPGRYMYDVVITNTASGAKYRAVEGIITVTPAITR